jgi:DNA-binding protein HU-beta
MNKAELSAVLADKCNMTKKQGEDMIDCLVETIMRELKNDHEVTITGFGTFSSFTRKAREGVNPQRPSEKINIAPTKVARFKAGKTLKDAMKESGHKSVAPQAPVAPVAPTAPAV